MILIIKMFAVLMAACGLALMWKPEPLTGFLRNNAEKAGLHALAIVARLLLGVLLISNAGFSTFPTTITVFGWLSLAGALFLLVIGRTNFIKLMNWAVIVASAYARAAAVFAIAFGAFLFYAFS